MPNTNVFYFDPRVTVRCVAVVVLASFARIASSFISNEGVLEYESVFLFVQTSFDFVMCRMAGFLVVPFALIFGRKLMSSTASQ